MIIKFNPQLIKNGTKVYSILHGWCEVFDVYRDISFRIRGLDGKNSEVFNGSQIHWDGHLWDGDKNNLIVAMEVESEAERYVRSIDEMLLAGISYVKTETYVKTESCGEIFVLASNKISLGEGEHDDKKYVSVIHPTRGVVKLDIRDIDAEETKKIPINKVAIDSYKGR